MSQPARSASTAARPTRRRPAIACISRSSLKRTPRKRRRRRRRSRQILGDTVAGRRASSAGTTTCAVMSAGMSAAAARAKGTSSVAASARRLRRTRGRTKCESPTVAPWPGKCLPHASTPARASPRAKASASRATARGVVPKARSPMTRLRGFDHTSRTGAKSRSMPTARSSRPIARPTASARRVSPLSPTRAMGGKWVKGGWGNRSTRPPSWSSATSGGTPAPVAWMSATSRRSCSADRMLRLKRMTPPGQRSARNSRVSRSRAGRGRPTMNKPSDMPECLNPATIAIPGTLLLPSIPHLMSALGPPSDEVGWSPWDPLYSTE